MEAGPSSRSSAGTLKQADSLVNGVGGLLVDLHLHLLANALQILVIPQGTFQRLLSLQEEQMVPLCQARSRAQARGRWRIAHSQRMEQV